jgi:S-adenosylmethionine:tRNA ribosyltransferase-isomerase
MIDPKHYDYTLPQELVAQQPASPRDSSKLFVYDTKQDTVTIDTFLNVSNYLPHNSVLVLNKTKVLPSRIVLYKENGGRVKTLFLVNELGKNEVKAMLDRGVEIGQSINFDHKYFFTVVGQDEHIFTLKMDCTKEQFITMLEKNGSMPIPPYLKHSTLTEKQLRTKYQTIFAQDKGSAAAPTASLHFTNRVFNKLERKGIEKQYVKLHVGAGTFAPLIQKNLEEQKLHTEWYEVTPQTAQALNKAKEEGKRIISVGTTVTRTLESAADKPGHLKAQAGETDIFIFSPYKFKITDILLTNFHVPKSSLMMLVNAFLQYKHARHSLHQLYAEAIRNKLRFFSFGDAMLIL